MKIIFTISEFLFFKEFWWKLAQQFAKDGNECIFLVDGKIAECGLKPEFVKENMKFISKVDWCIKNWDQNKKDFGDLNWKVLFPDFDRYGVNTFKFIDSFNAISQLYQFLDFVFKTEKPDMVITACPSNLFEQVARYFTDRNNVVWLALSESLLSQDRIDILDLDYTNSFFEKDFKNLEESEITEEEKKFSKDYVEKIVSHKEMPSYMRGQDVYSSYFKMFIFYLQRFIRINERKNIYLKYLNNRKHFKKCDLRSDIVFRFFCQTPLRDLKRQLALVSQKNLLESYKKDEKFFFYPLHYQPEYTTSVLAMYFTDQAATIRNIAFSLPFPYKLYVKEHPSSPGLRTKDFYKKIKQIPNVVLIRADEKIKNLVRDAEGVITLTSSVGMEGSFLGKPVYVLGKVFYSHHPFCKNVRDYSDLKDSISADLDKNTHDIKNLEGINNRFVTSYLRNTIEGNVFSGTKKNDANDYSKICKDLEKIFIIVKQNQNYAN